MGDTITYTDIYSVSRMITLDADSDHATASIDILPSGSTLTFTSSVAKNPDDLTADYSKSVTITDATSEIRVMPSGALYWWGSEVNCEDRTSAIGWILQQTFVNPTRNKNNISFVTTSTSYLSAIGAKNDVGSFSTINAIVNSASGDYKWVDTNETKQGNGWERHYISNTSNTVKDTFTPTSTLTGFPCVGTQNGSLTISAFWVE